jgi:hypothetical protein
LKELSDEVTHYAAENPLADSRDLATNVGFVTIPKPSATARLWSQVHEAAPGSEAQCS